MRQGRLIVLLVALLIAASTREASAICLICSCRASATGVSFGTHNPLQPTPDNATGSVSVTCSLLGTIGVLVSYQVALSAGNSGTYASRRMTVGTGQLLYNLYTDSSRSQIWGNGTGGSVAVSDSYLLAIGPETSRSYTAYGQISAGQNVPAGAYADTIVVTIFY